MSSATPAIEVVELQKTYAGVPAVAGLSLVVQPGEVFGLLGPNGAGKTTTVEILEGYRRPDAGHVRVLGLDPVGDAARLRPRVGVMLQEGGLAPGVRPLEILRAFAAFYDDAEEPEALLALVGLTESRRTLVRRLSGGQQQRLSLALAIIGRPALVFLDEPTAGMDPHARATTWQLVRGLRDRGVTVVLTTHAMDEAEQLCDRVAIIDHGHLVACGAPSALTREAVADDIRLSTQAGLPVDELAAALGLAPGAVLETRPGDYVVDASGAPERIAALAIWLRDRGARLEELRAGRRSLEEVFLRLTSEGRGA